MLLVSAIVLFSKLISVSAEFIIDTAKQGSGFVEVRPGAHLFYWLYYTTADVEHYTQRPLIIWLQGGPGGSSTGSGNFEYFGPIDLQGNKRNNSWVDHVNMLFIDSPVGAGFSYVEVADRYATTTSLIARDLVTCMKDFYAKHREFVPVPLHIFSESYGGKMAPEFALELYKAVMRGETYANIKSVTIGNPFLSIVETVEVVPSFLLQTGRIDLDGHKELSNIAYRVVEYLNDGDLRQAATMRHLMFYYALILTDSIDIYNIDKIMQDGFDYAYNPKLKKLMRGRVTKILNITTGYKWAEQRDEVFQRSNIDQTVSSVPTILELLNTTPIKIAFYSGQLDVLCPTLGTVNIINKMEWRDKPAYLAAERTPIKLNNTIEGFEKSDGKLSMFWINRAGHLVPMEKPELLNYIRKKITNY